MIRIEYHLNMIIYGICLLIKETKEISSIECCTSNDNTCSSKSIYCPSNVCFKLVLGKGSEERGCFEDLIKLLNPQEKNSQIFNEKNGLTNIPLNDQCHRLIGYGNGISLCRCTTHLCNSTTKDFSLSSSIFFLFISPLFFQL